MIISIGSLYQLFNLNNSLAVSSEQILSEMDDFFSHKCGKCYLFNEIYDHSHKVEIEVRDIRHLKSSVVP